MDAGSRAIMYCLQGVTPPLDWIKSARPESGVLCQIGWGGLITDSVLDTMQPLSKRPLLIQNGIFVSPVRN